MQFYMNSLAITFEHVMPSAAMALCHYLDGTGTMYNINMYQLIYIPDRTGLIDFVNYFYRTYTTGNDFTFESQSITATLYYYLNLEHLLLLARSVLKDGESITIMRTTPAVAYRVNEWYQAVEIDWFCTLGAGGSSAGVIANISRVGNSYIVDYRYSLYDTYDWAYNQSVLPGVLPQDVSMHTMLHQTGLAREYNVYGEFTNTFIIDGSGIDDLSCLEEVVL
mgnify:CR=1 FL=1